MINYSKKPSIGQIMLGDAQVDADDSYHGSDFDQQDLQNFSDLRSLSMFTSLNHDNYKENDHVNKDNSKNLNYNYNTYNESQNVLHWTSN